MVVVVGKLSTMPGTHTFYDGSTALQPIADIIGIEVDKISPYCLNF